MKTLIKNGKTAPYYMDVLKKTHKTKDALKSHAEKIKARGGNYYVDGLTIKYTFDEKARGKKEGDETSTGYLTKKGFDMIQTEDLQHS